MKILHEDRWNTNGDCTLYPIKEKDESGNFISEENRSILGVFEGNASVLDKTSENGRHYTRLFWETVINKPEVQERVNNLQMYGMIGHKETPVSDDDLNEGKVSHIVSKIWIAENLVKIRGVILNTKPGRNLFNFLNLEHEGRRSKLHLSSRAAGEYKDERYNGKPVVDENTYYLDTFDVVKEPGFKETNISLIKKPNVVQESKDKEVENKNDFVNKRGRKMELDEQDIKDFKLLIQEKKREADTAIITENISLKNEIKDLKEKTNNYAEESKLLEKLKSNKEVVFILERLISEDNLTFIKEWDKIGPPSLIHEAGDKTDKQLDILEKFTAYGDTPEVIGELLKVSEQKFDKLHKYELLGEPEVLEELIKHVTEINPLLEKIGDLNVAIKTLEDVNKILPEVTKKHEKSENLRLQKLASEMATKFNRPEKMILEHLKKIGEKDTLKHFTEIAESGDTDNNNDHEEKPNESKKPDKVISFLESNERKSAPNRIWDNMTQESFITKNKHSDLG